MVLKLLGFVLCVVFFEMLLFRIWQDIGSLSRDGKRVSSYLPETLEEYNSMVEFAFVYWDSMGAKMILGVID